MNIIWYARYEARLTGLQAISAFNSEEEAREFIAQIKPYSYIIWWEVE